MGGWRKKVERARQLHRPSLRNWACDDLYAKFPAFLEDLATRRDKYESCVLPGSSSRSTASGSNSRSRDRNDHAVDDADVTVPRVIDAAVVSDEDFVRRYESQEIPTVIQGIPDGSTNGNRPAWPARQRWDLNTLTSHPSLRHCLFKVGEDDDGKSLKLKLKDFVKYMKKNKDDSPLYIFDTAFDEDEVAKCLLEDYAVPSYFREDLFRLVGERRRPPYRWFLIGPQRSGTTIHYDPLATSAWNTLLSGKKRWVLFPPYVPKHVAKGSDLLRKGEDDEAVHYFLYILPRIKQQALSYDRSSSSSSSGDRPNNPYRNFKCYEFTQEAGETVFVPQGWWHAVLNLTDTVGITQNFCSQQNFDKVWGKTRSGRKKMAYKWMLQLEVHYPHLAARAKEMNVRDGFVMKYDPVEVQKRVEEEARRRQAKRSRREKKRKEKKRASRTCSRSSSSSSTSSRRNSTDRKRSRSSHSQSSRPTASQESSSSNRHHDFDEDRNRHKQPSRPVSP